MALVRIVKADGQVGLVIEGDTGVGVEVQMHVGDWGRMLAEPGRDFGCKVWLTGTD